MTRDQLLDQLEKLYRELTPPPAKNACGECKMCCTAAGVNVQRVTDLELALLERHYGAETRGNFQIYAKRVRNAEGYLFEVCPNYRGGCQVYEHRPFSCRVFGHYKPAQSRLPEGCVFIGSEREFAREDYYEAVPGARELRRLSREFHMFTGNPAQTPAAESREAPESLVFAGLHKGDVYDRVLSLMAENRIPEAWNLIALAPPEDLLFRHYLEASLAGMLDLHPQAYAAYRRLLESVSERADLWSFAGFHAFATGRFAEAEECLGKALELDDAQALAHGFTGYLRLQQGDLQAAAAAFARAAELEPENPVYRQRLAQINSAGR